MLAGVDPIVSPLGTPGTKRGRDRDDSFDSSQLMVEGSPSPAPDRESGGLIRERMKRQKLCGAMGDGAAVRGDIGLGFGRENSSNNVIRGGDGNRGQYGFMSKRSRGMGEKRDSHSLPSSQEMGDEHFFDAQNARRLQDNLYTHMERQVRASQDQTKKLEEEVKSLKQLNHRVLESLREKEEENRVLRRGVAIADGRNRDMQLQAQEMQAERRRDQSHISQAQNENNQLQMVLMQANHYIRQLESHVKGNKGSVDMQTGDGAEGFMDPPPPDVF